MPRKPAPDKPTGYKPPPAPEEQPNPYPTDANKDGMLKYALQLMAENGLLEGGMFISYRTIREGGLNPPQYVPQRGGVFVAVGD